MIERTLRMTYDPVADAAYIYIADPILAGEAVRTAMVDSALDAAALTLDFDLNNRLLGIELLGVSRLLRPDAIPAKE